jgi:DNA-binding NarL/FixJ family response regulator
MEKIAIAIVDDHMLFRQGVSALMKEFEELEVLFESANGQELISKMAHQAKPKVVLMDINMPVLDGYETTKWLKEHYPDVFVLALSMYEDDESVIKMIKNGACGYVLKEASPIDLLSAIKAVVEKGVFLNELVSGKLIRSFSKDPEVRFSQKEIEFLNHCCSEQTYKEIAEKMFVSPRTIDNYRESLFIKLHLKTRVGLVLYAIKQKIVSLN